MIGQLQCIITEYDWPIENFANQLRSTDEHLAHYTWKLWKKDPGLSAKMSCLVIFTCVMI